MAAKKTTPNKNNASPAYSLAEVQAHIPAGNPAVVAQLRELFHTAHPATALVALGSGFRTEDILGAAPSFLSQVSEQVGPLDPKQLPVGLAKEHATLLFDEATKLTALNQQFEDAARRNNSEVSKRRSALKTAQSKALRRRHVVARTLMRQVLSPESPRRAELERAAAKAENPAEIAASLSTVAQIVEAVRGETKPEKLAALDAIGLTEALPEQMREQARELELLGQSTPSNTPAPPVGQRELDRQDGVVLALMKQVYASMRDAGDGRITAPRIAGPLERLVVSTPGGADEEEEPSSPATDPVAS